MLTDFVSFQVFGHTAYAYGLTVGIAFLVWAGATALLGRKKLGRLTMAAFSLLSLLLGFVGARLVFALANIPYYVMNMNRPALMLSFWEGGYSLFGALLGAALAAVMTAKCAKVPVSSLLDAGAVTAGLFVCGARVAEHFSMLGYGRAAQSNFLASIPFLTITDEWDASVYAIYRLEALCALVILLVMLWQLSASRKTRRPGDLTLLFMVLLGATQTLLESWCKDGHMVIHFVKVSQVLSVLFVVLGAAGFTRRYVKIRKWNPGLVVAWVVLLASIGAGIFLEFKADRWENQLLVYGLFALCMVYWIAFPMAIWHKLKTKVYGEDRFNMKIGE